MKKPIIIIALTALTTIAIALTAVTAAVLNTQTVTSQGSITSSANIAIYSDENATTTCNGVDWGTLSPSSSTTHTIYIKNTGNVPQTLSMDTTGWSSSEASSVLTINWDQENTSIAAGQIIPATFTLTAAPDTGSLLDFSFDIRVTGSN